ncbi:MAG: hypothetical protein PHN51_11875 [Candidatus Nanopelagicales bacterium]|nr:hypothetical protein [Candidatus Nanopelagicales bacterium]
MTLKIETGELLTVIFCLYSTVGLPNLTTQRTIGAIHNVVTWMEVTQDYELVRFKAFAPQVHDAYSELLRSVRQKKTLQIPAALAGKIILDALWLDQVFTEDVYRRIFSELQDDKEMAEGDASSSLTPIPEISQTLNRSFAKD